MSFVFSYLERCADIFFSGEFSTFLQQIATTSLQKALTNILLQINKAWVSSEFPVAWACAGIVLISWQCMHHCAAMPLAVSLQYSQYLEVVVNMQYKVCKFSRNKGCLSEDNYIVHCLTHWSWRWRWSWFLVTAGDVLLYLQSLYPNPQPQLPPEEVCNVLWDTINYPCKYYECTSS